MRVRILTLTLLASAVTAAPATASILHGPTKVRTPACRADLEQAERFAVFEGEMRTIAGAARLQMRLQLQARTPGRDRWTRVVAPGFGIWNSASPGVRKFVYTKRVENLLAPAKYRVAIKYRWLDGAGNTLRTDERKTPVCRQPDLRANLTPTAIDVEAGSSDRSRTYVVAVTNDGRLSAAGFNVRLTVNGQPQPLAAIAGLTAGEHTMLSLEGPVCLYGSTVSVVLDPNGVIDEADEADNTVTVTCPAEA